jgi:hypothetical protein
MGGGEHRMLTKKRGKGFCSPKGLQVGLICILGSILGKGVFLLYLVLEYRQVARHRFLISTAMVQFHLLQVCGHIQFFHFW